MSYRIPEPEESAFYGLPVDVQREIKAVLEIFAKVNAATRNHKMHTWESAIRYGNDLLAARGVKVTLNQKTLNRKRKLFNESGRDWTTLIDRRKVPDWDTKLRRRVKAGANLHPSFISHVRGLAQRNGRSSAQAIDELYRAWRAGEHVPGYGTWYDWYRREFPDRELPELAPIPDGWSHSNLGRHMPDQAALEAARRGIAAATMTLPSIIRTRAGLRPMEWVVLDDWRADFLVYVPGIQDPVELNGILAMDVASAMAMRFGVRPSLPREDGSHEGLKRLDAKSIVAEILMRFGYPLDYRCNIIVERGTATITPADAAAIEEVTNGQVKVHWTSMISGAVFGWKDRPVGNFKGKAWLESFFNLLHNVCANLPGQIGAHYSKRPRRIPAMTKEAKALVRAQQQLPESLRDTLNYRMPFLDVVQAAQALRFVFHYVNHRERHNLEAFEKVLKYRLDEHDRWRPVQELLEKGWTREMILSLRPRPFIETPADRWRRLSRDVRFQRVPMEAAPLLLTDHRKVTVETEGEINLGSKSHPKIYRDRQNPHLKKHKKYLAHVSTQDDAWVHLTDGRSYITSVPRLDAIQHGDTEATAREIAEKASQLNAKLKQARADDITQRQRLADINHNLEVVDSQLAAVDLIKAPAIDAETLPASAAAINAAEAAIVGCRQQRATRKQAFKKFKPADLLDDDEEAFEPAGTAGPRFDADNLL
jgi:hypothetical protein